MAQLGVIDKLFGSTTLTEQKASMAKKTYALLSLSIVSCIVGIGLSLQSQGLIAIFDGEGGVPRWIPWLVMFGLINAVPYIALWASTKSKPFATVMLVVDGLLSGVALSPLVHFAEKVAKAKGFATDDALGIQLGGHALSIMAALITLAMFLGITGYIMLARKRFSAPAGMMSGLFIGLIVAIGVNTMLDSDAIGYAISIGICIFGVFGLVYATSHVLNNPDFQNPIWGALMLFAALFNIFVSVLRILLYLVGGGRNSR